MHNDMTGQKFNMLTIIEDNGGGVVKVRCDCGTVKTCNRSNIVSGKLDKVKEELGGHRVTADGVEYILLYVL